MSAARARLRPLVDRGDERGIVAIVVTLSLVVLLGSAAMAVDIARLNQRKDVLQKAVDFGALAAAQNLPVKGTSQGTAATAVAGKVTLANASGLAAAGTGVQYRCIVGERNGGPDLYSVPAVCGPETGTWSAGWTAIGTTRYWHACDPAANDKCNAVRVTAKDTVPFAFAPVLGYKEGSTGTLSAQACKGTCGNGSGPLDVVMVIDRTVSMSLSDMANVKAAAVAVLDVYDAKLVKVGLVVLPYPSSTDPCAPANPQVYPNSGNQWWSVAMNQSYDKADGSLDTSSTLVTRINCLKQFSVSNNLGSGNTELGDPIRSAKEMLAAQGRAGVPDVMIFMTDGEANQPKGNHPCKFAVDEAKKAKDTDVEIYVIAYGVAGARCSDDTSGPYVNAYATKFLADIATSSNDNLAGGCASNENTDGDHYFCESRSADLTPVFRTVATASTGRNSSLVGES